MDAKAIVNGTIAALEKGQYTPSSGATVNLVPLLETCLYGTQCFTPDELAEMRDQVLSLPQTLSTTTYALANETTLEGCAHLVASQHYQRIGVLNFASAKHPGGGFLGGARAQEESLARSSGLYFSLRRCPEHYAFHQAQQSCLYSDRMIYSPACPVFRDDAGNWLEQPYTVDFITSPAPNAGAIMTNEPENRSRIVPTLRERAGKILALAIHHECDALILGAWGCGVFRNDPFTVATIFADLLKPTGPYHQRFQHIRFSVYDPSHSQSTFAAFLRQLTPFV